MYATLCEALYFCSCVFSSFYAIAVRHKIFSYKPRALSDSCLNIIVVVHLRSQPLQLLKHTATPVAN